MYKRNHRDTEWSPIKERFSSLVTLRQNEYTVYNIHCSSFSPYLGQSDKNQGQSSHTKNAYTNIKTIHSLSVALTLRISFPLLLQLTKAPLHPLS